MSQSCPTATSYASLLVTETTITDNLTVALLLQSLRGIDINDSIPTPSDEPVAILPQPTELETARWDYDDGQ